MEVSLLHLLAQIHLYPHKNHFFKLKYFNLDELWFVSSRGNSRTFFPIHDLANDLYSLSGCDISSKIGTKRRAVIEGANCYHFL